MVFVIDSRSLRSELPPPAAWALAALLHALVALGLWEAWVQRPPVLPDENAIEVSFELPERAEIGRAAPGRASPTQALPVTRPSTAPLARRAPLVPRLALDQQVLPLPAPAFLPAPSEVAALPDSGLAPIPAPPLPSLLASPPPPSEPRPRIEPRSAALATEPPPVAEPADEPPERPDSPAEAYLRARVADGYLRQVLRKLEGYSYQAAAAANRGVTVVRIVIARDGKLIEAGIARSSGVPEFDRGVLAGVRAGSPYTPLPPDVRGDSATFELPLASVAGR